MYPSGVRLRHDESMALPDWNIFPGGGTKRAALWLLAEVGEGGTFTKSQLRAAFPGESQIDRRVRDLRDEGWVIHTNREDVSLLQEEQRLVSAGGRVWEEGYESVKARMPSAKERQAIFVRDNYACSLCGITGGEQYPGDPLSRAKLTVARVEGPGDSWRLSTVCELCRRGGAQLPVGDDVRALVANLDVAQRSRLAGWVRQGRRGLTPEERAWANFRRLPSESRDEFKTWLLGSN